MRNKILILFFLIKSTFYFSLYSQIISGKVIDKETQEPIQNASVRLGKRGIITDSKGNFSLHYKETDWEHNTQLLITSIGYHKFEIPIKSFHSPQIIPMNAQNKELQEVIVSSSAKEIITKAIAAIPKNYNQNEFVATGNFLETNRRTKSDTVFTINFSTKTQMSYNKNHSKTTKVQLLSYSKTKSKTIDSANYIHWYNDGKVLEYLDLIHSEGYFINPRRIPKYNYTLLDIANINDRSTYIIKFSLKRNPKKLEGIVNIDEETLAITSLEYIDSDLREGNSDSTSDINEKRIYQGKIQYKLINDKWYLNTCSQFLSAKIRDIPAYISVEYRATEIDTLNQALQLTYKNKITSDMFMENLSEEINPINKNQPNGFAKNPENLGFLKIGKHFKFSVKYYIGLNSPSLLPHFTNPYSNWQNVFGFTPNEVHNNYLPNFKAGINFIFNRLNVGTGSSLISWSRNSYQKENTLEFSKYFVTKNNGRPLLFRPTLGIGYLDIYDKLGTFLPNKKLQQEHYLANEAYNFTQHVSLTSLQLGANVGIHLTRIKIIELGINYHIPTAWNSELKLIKTSNNVFQNLFGKNSSTISIPFETISNVPNQLSFHLYYHFL